MKRIVAGAIAALCLVVGIVSAWQTHRATRHYEEVNTQLASYASVDALASEKLKRVAEKLTFGLYVDKARGEIEALQAKRTRLAQAIRRDTMIALSLWVAAVAIAWFAGRQAMLFMGALVSGMMLVFGLWLPMLRMTIHKTVPYLGDAVFSYETKSVVDTIGKLLSAHEWIVGGAILLFSVIVPWSKTLLLMFVALVARSRFGHRAVVFFKHLGKWSMLDVFVVATLLVFLSMRENGLSRASMGEGVYFFLGYVLLSIVSGLVAEKVVADASEASV